MTCGIAQQYGELDCLPLRAQTTQTTSGQRGRVSTSTTATEVTVLREEGMPPGTFELPADYEAVPFMSFVPDDVLGAMEEQPAAEPQERGRRPRLRDLLR